MLVFIHLEGRHHVTNVQPITLLEIKQRIDVECGLDAHCQIMWDQQARGMRTCRNAVILNANISNEHIHLVLRFGAWAYFDL